MTASSLTEAMAVAVVLWFAIGWYFNDRLSKVHAKLDSLSDQLNGLRDYLYEIDPQFDDERDLLTELNESLGADTLSFAGMNHVELIEKKETEGRRTLNSNFLEGGFRAPAR